MEDPFHVGAHYVHDLTSREALPCGGGKAQALRVHRPHEATPRLDPRIDVEGERMLEREGGAALGEEERTGQAPLVLDAESGARPLL